MSFAGAADAVVAFFHPHSYPFWLVACSLLAFLVERAWPWRRTQRVLRTGFAQDLAWLVFNGHIAALLIAVPASLAAAQLDALCALLSLPAPSTFALIREWPWWAQLAVVLVLKDFLDYGVHRLLHRVPALWEFHKVHHSIRELDWIGSFRFHWMEIVVYGTVTYVPLVALGAAPTVLLANGVVGTLIGHLNHANVRTDYGPLRYVVNSPRFHVWHHDRLEGAGAADAGHAGAPCNFAIVLSVWDWLFGTARYPRGDVDQPHALGFAGDDAFPQSLVERLLHPLPAGFRRLLKRRASVEP